MSAVPNLDPITLDPKIGVTVTPVRSRMYASNPVIGHVVEDRKGYIAIPSMTAEPALVRESFDSAVDYIRRARG